MTNTTPDLVEQIARAICKMDDEEPNATWRIVGNNIRMPFWRKYEPHAVAALKVMQDELTRLRNERNSLEARVAELEGALINLEIAEEQYRSMHGSTAATRAWAVMHKAGDRARAALRASEATAGRETTGQESSSVVS